MRLFFLNLFQQDAAETKSSRMEHGLHGHHSATHAPSLCRGMPRGGGFFFVWICLFFIHLFYYFEAEFVATAGAEGLGCDTKRKNIRWGFADCFHNTSGVFFLSKVRMRYQCRCVMKCTKKVFCCMQGCKDDKNVKISDTKQRRKHLRLQRFYILVWMMKLTRLTACYYSDFSIKEVVKIVFHPPHYLIFFLSCYLSILFPSLIFSSSLSACLPPSSGLCLSQHVVKSNLSAGVKAKQNVEMETEIDAG